MREGPGRATIDPGRRPLLGRSVLIAAAVAVCALSCAPELQRARRAAAGLSAKVEPAIKQAFCGAGVEYPPGRVLLLAFKKEKRLELHALRGGKFVFIKSYPILGASGVQGPKLREGDRQVPEGVYPVTGLNPDSTYHMSLAIGYPNDFDLAMAARDGRADPGGDIHIHGGDYSVGCLAVGDAAVEELFVLAVRAGKENMRVIIAPGAPMNGYTPPAGSPRWTVDLYRSIRAEMARLGVLGFSGREIDLKTRE